MCEKTHTSSELNLRAEDQPKDSGSWQRLPFKSEICEKYKEFHHCPLYPPYKFNRTVAVSSTWTPFLVIKEQQVPIEILRLESKKQGHHQPVLLKAFKIRLFRHAQGNLYPG